MKNILALNLIALWCLVPHAQAHAAEGRVSQLGSASVEEARASSYSGATSAGGVGASIAQKGTTGKSRIHTGSGGRSAKGKVSRASPTSLSAHAAHFYIYDAGSRLITDRDGDAYHSEFRIRFDADSYVGDALVYAKLYLRRAGEREWWLYHETDDFWIYGQSGDDDYYVTTTLDDGFPTSEYDVLVDLYEVGYSGIVATIT